jgi:LPS sulfotransferase NodH
MATTRFVIATHPRTGSNWLCSVLNSHPAILCHYEVLHPNQIYYAPSYPERRPSFTPSLAERDADPRAFVDDLFSRDYGHDAVGVKLMPGHAPVLTAELLRDPCVRTIVLRRENRVRVFLSIKRATRAGKFTEVSYDGMPIELDPAELRAFCRRYDEYFAWLDRHLVRQEVLRLSYERLFDGGEISRVLDFLGAARVAESSLEAKHARQSFDDLPDAVSNFRELERRFRRTELAAELVAG